MDISVEIEPPKGIFRRIDEGKSSIYDEVMAYMDHVEMISITNRPVFGLSPLTLASQIHKLVKNREREDVRVNLHLTTRSSHFDIFKTVLDAQRIGLSDLLPILGDPRGPKNENYFKNGFDILGFVAFLKTGDRDHLRTKYIELLEKGELVGPIDNATFNVGTVVDVNPTKTLRSRKKIEIRDKQIKFARRKERLGAEYLISQAIFDADYYFEFIDEANLKIPVLPGVLPARTKLIDMFGLPIDDYSKQKLRAQFTTEEEREIGNQISREVFLDLKDRGCEFVHVYSIGNSKNFSDITGIMLEESYPPMEEIGMEGEVLNQKQQEKKI